MITFKKLNNKQLTKELEKIKKSIGEDIRESDIKEREINGIKLSYNYYYYVNDKTNYKDLTYVTLTNNNITYLLKVNKCFDFSTMLYQFINNFDFRNLLKDYKQVDYVLKISNLYWRYTSDMKLFYKENLNIIFDTLENKFQEIQILIDEKIKEVV